MLKWYMHRRERYFAMLNDNRVVRPFEWGTQFANGNGGDPRNFFKEFSRDTVENSDRYFALPEEIGDVEHELSERNERELRWKSHVESSSPENDTVRARLFPFEKNKRSAVVILPHWNAREGSYFDLCRILNRVGITALRMTLPYHEARMPPDLERADHLVAPNVGLTLQSVRQAVIDTRTAVRWLKHEGYERIGILGTSIGSCTAFLAFVHDMNIDAGVFNHVSGYFADVVWKGLSTYHVREAIEKELSLEELREYWLPISPMTYMGRLAAQPWRPQRYIYTLYDLTFPIDLSLDTMRELRRLNIKHDEVVLPCGHYTLGEKPWAWVDGYKIVTFLRNQLKENVRSEID
jgi:hypothetical protein